MDVALSKVLHGTRLDGTMRKIEGKDIAVIGTGCGAIQFIPRVAEEAASTTIFQRTPNWLMPRPQYQKELPQIYFGVLTIFLL